MDGLYTVVNRCDMERTSVLADVRAILYPPHLVP